MRLYHYTCSHSRAKILLDGILKPNERSYRRLLWLTDLEVPHVQGLGLTSFMLRCDRTEWRVTVNTEIAERWTEYAHRMRVEWPIRQVLDGVPGAQPLHWWVSEVDIPITVVERAEKGVRSWP